MGQRASRHEGGAKKVKTGLALSASGVREVNVLRYSHPAPLPIRSSSHKNIIELAPATETPQHGSSQTLSTQSTYINKSIKEVPVGLLLKIVNYLPPTSVRSLSYTCRFLSQTFGASAAELMGKQPGLPRLKPAWAMSSRWYRGSGIELGDAQSDTDPDDHWWELLIMLHRDNMWPGKAVCGACNGVHKESAFSQSSLHGPPEESKCLGMSGWVKICPHIQFDSSSLQETNNSPETYKRLLRAEHARFPDDPHDEDEDRVPGAWKARLDPKQIEGVEVKRAQRREARGLARTKMAAEEERVWTIEKEKTCKECIIPVTITSWGKSRVCFPLAVTSQQDYKRNISPPAGALTNHMRSLKAAVCPHLKVNSSDVMEAYCPSCKRFGGWGCNCPLCSVPYQQCALCKAKFWFDIGDFSDLKLVIHLVVERSFDPSVGVTSSTWINQLIPETASNNEHESWWFDRMRFRDSMGYRVDEDSIKDREYDSGISYASRECSRSDALAGLGDATSV